MRGGTLTAFLRVPLRALRCAGVHYYSLEGGKVLVRRGAEGAVGTAPEVLSVGSGVAGWCAREGCGLAVRMGGGIIAAAPVFGEEGMQGILQAEGVRCGAGEAKELLEEMALHLTGLLALEMGEGEGKRSLPDGPEEREGYLRVVLSPFLTFAPRGVDFEAFDLLLWGSGGKEAGPLLRAHGARGEVGAPGGRPLGVVGGYRVVWGEVEAGPFERDCGEAGARAAIGVPLGSGIAPLGSLMTYRSPERPWGAGDRDILMDMAPLLLWEMEREGILSAARDRRRERWGQFPPPAFRLEVHRECARSRRTGEPLSLVLVQRRGGRPLGARPWGQAERAIRQAIRAADRLAPCGPRAFILLLPGTDRGEAERVAIRLLPLLPGLSDPSTPGVEWKGRATAFPRDGQAPAELWERLLPFPFA